MIRSIRGRLQWWYGAVYAVSILVFGCLVYWRSDRDVHERATLQAVSTAQYLDLSLRAARPRFGPEHGRTDAMSPGNPEARAAGAGPFPPEFALGPLPPEFQFRPPRDRDDKKRPAHPDDLQGPGRVRPAFGPGEQGRAGRIGEDHGPGRDPWVQRQPPDRPALEFEGPGRMRRPEERPNVPPNMDQPPPPDFEEGDEQRPPMDRMEFVVWREDGSLLTQSHSVPAQRAARMPTIERRGPVPVVSVSRTGIDVMMRGAMGTTILVVRPLEHDLANLHRFGFRIAGMAVITLLVGLFGGWWISGRIVRPIHEISQMASRISATSLNHRIETGHLDEELVQLASVLNSTFGRLQESFGRLTQFTADASHELRTPLAVIQSQIELALSQPRTVESYQRTLETCQRSSERMRSLIDGLLMLARTDSDRLELHRTGQDLPSIVEEAVGQLQDKAVKAGIDLECVTPESAIFVRGDAAFLVRIPINLIDNAIQHSPEGGKVCVEVSVENNFAVLSVKDTGSGIPADHLPYIFERFYRVDVGRSRAQGGSGLGLAICQSIVQSHDGTLQCFSNPGEGTMFVVRLPLSIPTAFHESNSESGCN